MPKRAGEMHAIHYYFFILLFVFVFSSPNGMSKAVDDALEKRQPDCKLSLGAVVDYTSLAGKKKKKKRERKWQWRWRLRIFMLGPAVSGTTRLSM
jgi:hypothetical protein